MVGERQEEGDDATRNSGSDAPADQIATEEPSSAAAPIPDDSEQTPVGVADETSPVSFPIVAIGASAGGIEALGEFFAVAPADTGCAFVVILHLDPTRQSNMAHILANQTSMPVTEVQTEMPVTPDHVYVIAPDSGLEISGDVLRVVKSPAPRGLRHPIDAFFASLSENRRERAIAIVLSGTGSNGTEGLREIRGQGGIGLVQAPESAKFDGMPRSAIAAGFADRVLTPKEMPEAVLHFIQHGYVTAPAKLDDDATGGPATLDRVLDLVRARTGVDFRGYKKNTLRRRVNRRLGLKNMTGLDSYIADLVARPAEVRALAKDLLISVTGFFRDADAWRTLAEAVIVPLVAGCARGGIIRCWVPACATGEEAYSIAMLIVEAAESARKQLEIKVFATDAQEDNLRRAREGTYPEAAVTMIPPERLRRFFTPKEGFWKVAQELRDLVVIAPHNLLHDPPFSRLDLVSCRNFLIYLEPESQRRVTSLFHFALRSGGYLFLGNAETVGRHDDLFDVVSKNARIYKRIGQPRSEVVEYPLTPDAWGGHGAGDTPPQASPQPEASAVELARQTLLARYAPASVLLDQRDRVLYFQGTTRDYLEHPPGEPTNNLPSMVRTGLAAPLRPALRQVRRTHKSLVVEAVVHEDGTERPVAITVAPLTAPSPSEGFLLVSFVPIPSRVTPEPRSAHQEAHHATAGEDALREELKVTRTELQSSIEHLETANEELKAANEEAISMNEELQSTNEELETSKEELQSFNEELNTINSQLQFKLEELEDATNDLNNLLAGASTATLFLDSNLCIKWFSPATRELFDFVSSDVGRPISHFARKFTDENLLSDATSVLERLTTADAEVPSDAGRWYARRMLPYRTLDNRIAGLVVTFNDITERRHSAEEAAGALLYSNAILATMRQPLLVLNGDLRVRTANAAFYRLFAVTAGETEGHLLYELGNGQWDTPRLRVLLDEVLSKGHDFSDFEIEHDFAAIGPRAMLLNARKLSRRDGHQELILLALEDVTDRKSLEHHREMVVGELNHRIKNIMTTVQAIASQTLRDKESMKDARTAFSARLVAFSRAQDFLTHGGRGGADFAALVHEALAAYGSGTERFRIRGPRLWLPRDAIVSVVMTLNELATNAAKYGALSTPAGTVEITWQFIGQGEARHATFVWNETGGPPVTRPTHFGFGSRLVRRAVAMDLGGTVTISYESPGIVCTIDAPMPEGPDGRDDEARAEEGAGAHRRG